MSKSTFVIGTRMSRLALWQTEHITQELYTLFPDVTFSVASFTTQGDRQLDQPLPAIGGKGLFTSELEQALRSGEIDLAVHSLKDLPVENAEGLTLGAICSRADVRDVLIAGSSVTIAELSAGAVIGTSSLRRRAQLLARRPDLDVRSIRGNVDTRLRKVLDGQYDAALLAAAGLRRLDLDAHIVEWLDVEIMLPAPGQAALAVQCRADDAQMLTMLAAIDDAPARAATTAERSFLSALGGGCSAPIGAYARVRGNLLHLEGLVATPDGERVVRVSGSGADAADLGVVLAQAALTDGAAEILQVAA